MLESVRIERFRGIPSLTLADLRRVNVFIGTNGAGKTTALEAIAVLANPTGPGLLAKLSEWREMAPLSALSDDGVRAFFPNMEVEQGPDLTFFRQGREHRLEVRAVFEQSTIVRSTGFPTAGQLGGFGRSGFSGYGPQAGGPISMMGSAGSFEPGPSGMGSTTPTGTTVIGGGLIYDTAPRFRGIKYLYYSPGNPTIEATLQLLDVGYQAHGAPPTDALGSFYIHARRATSAGETANLLTQLYEKRLEESLLDGLRSVDQRVTRLQAGVRANAPVVFVDIGLPRLVPMNVLGDGFCRCALIATGLLFGDPQLVIIDEIDSGLHHTVMKSFWGSLANLARVQNRQVFCTTHDEEMLRSTLDAFATNQDELRIFRLDRHKDGRVTAEQYTYERFCRAEQSGVEIR